MTDTQTDDLPPDSPPADVPPADDPFLGNEGVKDPFEEASAEATPAPPADVPPADDIPIVDREGAPAEPTAPAPVAEQPAEAAPAPPAAPEQPEAAPASPEAVQEPQEPPSEPTPTTEPQTASDGAQPPQEPPTANGTDDDSSGEGDPPPASGTAKQVRLYKLLYQTGKAQWTEADLTDDKWAEYRDEKDGDTFLKARNNEHALRIAYSVLGRPDNGVTVAPIAVGSWKPRRVAKAAPRPERERLEIS